MSSMVKIGNYTISQNQLTQMRRDRYNRSRHVLSINPPIRPIFAVDYDTHEEWLRIFAMMSDGAEYAEGLRLGSGY